jgi:hypothetical protein
MRAWETLAQRLRTYASFPQDKDGKALSTRFNLLVKKYRENAVHSMRKSGREEEFFEREQLLEEIDSELRNHQAAKDEEKKTSKRSRADVSLSVVDELEGADRDSQAIESSEDDRRPRKKQNVVEAFGTERAVIDVSDRSLEERKLDLMQRQLDLQQQHLDQQDRQLALLRDHFQRQFQLQTEQMKMQQQQLNALLAVVNKLTSK